MSPCRDTEKPKRTLSTIPESNSSSSPSLSTARMPALSNTSSLRRRRRQLLRTPSVERDFSSRAPTIASTADPDAESSSSSGSSQSDSSPSPHPYSVDTPPTTVEGLDEDLAAPVSAQEGEGYYDGDETDPYDRPDSRSTYCTARSDLGED
ncbi:hypothetical protein LshimejAT787_0702920 [Lyophyllum shimeji]|uniref:Uncharacterized protein n=1 Tax=Lyophyllum shimeji TaxID=47721 RepID=A0A9P3PQZ6_LYOSH|nr:hypothetical protein LshimejAT787_0702920 [Lyophyllum shimeji]